MGARGPAKKPAALKVLPGSNNRDSGGRRVPQGPNFLRQAPEKPESLSTNASRHWDRIVPDLDRLGLLKDSDALGLSVLCELAADHDRLVELLSKTSPVVRQPSGRFARSPLADLRLKVSAEIRAWSHEFGITPSAEMNLAGTPDDPALGSPFDGRPRADHRGWSVK